MIALPLVCMHIGVTLLKLMQLTTRPSVTNHKNILKPVAPLKYNMISRIIQNLKEEVARD